MKEEKKKKKEKKTAPPKAAEDDYTVSDSQMEQLIWDLSKTIYWSAIVKYLVQRRELAEDTLYSLDPFKQPTETARAQGIRSGLMDLIEYVSSLERIRKEKAKETAGL